MLNPKIDIVTIPVENLIPSTAFYRELFALSEDKISTGEDHVAFFLEGGISLVLFERAGFARMTKQKEATVRNNSVIFSHTAKDSEEVNSILSRAIKAGGTLLKEGAADDFGYTGLFKDIDGHTWEVMSWFTSEDNSYTIEVNREYKHDPETLFKGWTSAHVIKELFGLTEIEMDVRVGGSFRFATNQVDSKPGIHTEFGEYKVLIQNKRIEKSWVYEGPMSPDKTIKSEIMLEFTEPYPNVTKVVLRERSSFLSEVDRRNQSRDKWTQALIEIESHLGDL